MQIAKVLDIARQLMPDYVSDDLSHFAHFSPDIYADSGYVQPIIKLSLDMGYALGDGYELTIAERGLHQRLRRHQIMTLASTQILKILLVHCGDMPVDGSAHHIAPLSYATLNPVKREAVKALPLRSDGSLQSVKSYETELGSLVEYHLAQRELKLKKADELAVELDGVDEDDGKSIGMG